MRQDHGRADLEVVSTSVTRSVRPSSENRRHRAVPIHTGELSDGVSGHGGRDGEECLREHDRYSGGRAVANDADQQAIEGRGVRDVGGKQGQGVSNINSVGLRFDDESESCRGARSGLREAIAALSRVCGPSADRAKASDEGAIVGRVALPLGGVAEQVGEERGSGGHCDDVSTEADATG